jgi:aldose 1-epimerase
MTDRALEMLHLRDHDAALEAAFVPGAGMLCCSLRHRGHELLAQNAGVAAYAEHGKTMGIPLLYPWANRLAAFDYTAAGRHVQVPHDPSRVRLDAGGLPIHGVVGGRLAWEVLDGAEDGGRAGGSEGGVAGGARALVATLAWSEAQPELFEVFPFRHELRYEARLGGGRLEIEVSVHACGEDNVPIAFGFHPYLVPSGGALPSSAGPEAGSAREGWLVELPAMRALELDASQIPVGPGRELAPERFELGDRVLDDGFDSVAQAARFSVEGGGRRIEVSFARGYQCAQVFAPAAGQYICFEPMTAPANALRSGEGLRLLAPGETFAASFTVAVGDSG